MKKSIRERGKVRFSEYFKKLNKGDKVGVVRELAIRAGFPESLQGRTGYVVGERGEAYIVNIQDKKKMKQYLIKPVHLKLLK